MKTWSLVALSALIFGSIEVHAEPFQNFYIQQPVSSFHPYLASDYPPIYFPTHSHWVIKVAALGDSLEIEDGSVWELEPRDGYRALYWQSNDPITITQNRAWFSSYKYLLVNQSKGCSIESNLKMGPFENGQYTHFVLNMNRRRAELGLTNGMNLEICPRDVGTYRNWREGQAVILGENSGWEGSYDLLLINVNMDNFVRAKQF